MDAEPPALIAPAPGDPTLRANVEEAFTKPLLFDGHRGAFEWDGDPWIINTVGHGTFGSELYMRARMCQVPWYGALAFAAGSTTLWEYGLEGNGVRPSALDLTWTPLAGHGAPARLRHPMLTPTRARTHTFRPC